METESGPEYVTFLETCHYENTCISMDNVRRVIYIKFEPDGAESELMRSEEWVWAVSLDRKSEQ